MRLQVVRAWLVTGMYFAGSVLAGCGGSNGGTLIVNNDASTDGTESAVGAHPGDDGSSGAQDDGGGGGGSASSGSGSPGDDGTDDSGSGSKSGSGSGSGGGGTPPIPVPDGGAPSDP